MMDPRGKHYETLELAFGASDTEIKQAYHNLARKWHPDKNSSPGAEEKFKDISEAYHALVGKADNSFEDGPGGYRHCNCGAHGGEWWNQYWQQGFGHTGWPTGQYDANGNSAGAESFQPQPQPDYFHHRCARGYQRHRRSSHAGDAHMSSASAPQAGAVPFNCGVPGCQNCASAPQHWNGFGCSHAHGRNNVNNHYQCHHHHQQHHHHRHQQPADQHRTFNGWSFNENDSAQQHQHFYHQHDGQSTPRIPVPRTA